MTQLTSNLTVWELWYFKAVTSYRGERFQVPTRLTTFTRQTGEYKVDLTRHPKFPLAFVQVHILVNNFCVEGLEKQKLTVLRSET